MATEKKSLIVPLLFILFFGILAWKVNSHFNTMQNGTIPFSKQSKSGVGVESFVQNVFSYFNKNDYVGYTKDGRQCKSATDQYGFKYIPLGCVPVTFNRLEITH